jgi:uncharacterized protein YjiS (DUF1127 family)
MTSPHSARSSIVPMPASLRRLMETSRRRRSLQTLMNIDENTRRDIGLTRSQMLEALIHRRPI